jgi:3-hydroxybutyryl-CoA dehydrogenase
MGVIRRVAVVGTGTLGTQICLTAANAGYQVTGFDPQVGSLDKALEMVRPRAETSKRPPLVPLERWAQCRKALRLASSMEQALRDADLVIEAVPEDLELKKKTWRELGRLAPAQAILATNSSSIPVSRLEEAGGRPERSLNIHFYQPLLGMHMVDVMGGTSTSQEVLELGVSWVRSLGCIPLTVRKELLGFCFNRVWRAIKRETLHMWAGGFVDFRDVDRAWMVFTGMDLGPFGLMDAVGLDVVYDIEMVYYEDSGDSRDRPPEALREMVERGDLGVKTGRGFYRYPDPEFGQPGFLEGVDRLPGPVV